MKIGGMEAKNDYGVVSVESRQTIDKTIDRVSNDNPSVKQQKETNLSNLIHLSEQEKNELPIPEKVLINAIEKANKAISGANRRFEFSIHEKTKEIMVKVINSDTNEVIREIPPEKILDMVAKMWEMAGILVDERR